MTTGVTSQILRARQSAELLAKFLDFVPASMAMLDRQMRYLAVNHGWRTEFALGDQPLVGRSHFELFPEMPERWKELLRRCLTGAVEKSDEDQFVRPDGTVHWLRWQIHPWHDTAGDIGGLIIFSEDITVRKRAEQALRASEHKSRAIFDAAAYPCSLQSYPNNVIVEVNDAWVRLYGYTREEAVGKTALELGIIRDDAVRRLAIREIEEHGEVHDYEWTLITKSGVEVIGQLDIVMLTIDGEPFHMTTVRDITEQRRLERAAMDSATREQRKLGRDLHDGLAQELVALSLLASSLTSSARQSAGDTAGTLEDIAHLAQQAVANCRALARGLSPLEYGGYDLRSALQELVQLNRRSYGIDIQFEAGEEAPLMLSPSAQDNLFRIAQEAVSNARRHGNARLLNVSLDVQPTTIRMVVDDDGTGIQATADRERGMGLRTMAFRAQQVGARLSIGPGPRGGTRVAVECPQPS